MILKRKNIIKIVLCVSIVAIFTSCENQGDIDQSAKNIEKSTVITMIEEVTPEQDGTTVINNEENNRLDSPVNIENDNDNGSETKASDVEIEDNLPEKRTSSKKKEHSTEDILKEAIKQLEELDAILSE